MGGKVKTYLGAALGIAAIWATGGGAAPWVVGLLQGATVVVGGLAARDAKKRAQQSQRDALQDRKVMYRSGVSAKGYLYGQAFMSGAVAFHRSPKSKADPFFWLVLALPIKHRIQGIRRIYFGDRSLGPIAPNGDATSPEFTRTQKNTGQHTGAIPPGNVVTVPLFGGDSGFILTPAQGGKIICAIRRPEPVQNTGEDTYQDWQEKDVAATVEGWNQIRIPGTVGDEFQITYIYQTTTVYIKAWTYRGTPDQVANGDLIVATMNESPSMRWDESCRLRGVPYIILRIRPDPDIFPRELENIVCWVDGKDDVLDTRTGLTGFTVNPMLIARDYAIEQCGVIAGDIQISPFGAEANICEELIVQPDPVTGVPTNTRRYVTNCFLSTESTPRDNLATILASCDGTAVECGATVDFRCGHYEEPVLALTDSDFASDPEIVKSPDLADTFNGVKPRYTDGSRDFWPVVDGTEYQSAFYLAKDKGRVRTEEIDLLAITNGTAAYRVAKQILHRHRAGFTMTALFKLKAEQVAPYQTVWVTHRALGSQEKVYRVLQYDPMSLSTVRLTLQEDGPLLYRWDFDEAAGIDPAPNSILPSVRNVPLIQGLAADTSLAAMTRGPEGDLTAQCKVYWLPVTDPLVLRGGHIEIRYKRSIDKDWNRSRELPPQATEHRFPVFRNDVLIIEVRLANSLVKGDWTQITKVADDAPTPYLAGTNILRNSRWIHTGGPGTEQYVFENWTAYTQSGTTTNFGGTFFPSFMRDGFEQTGAVAIGHSGTGTNHARWLDADPIPVEEGEWYVGYVSANPVSASMFLNILWYGKNGNYLDMSSSDYSYDMPVGGDTTAKWPRPNILKQAPVGAFSAAFRIVMRKKNVQPAVLILARPLFGRAADGQFGLPPWSPT